MKTIYNGCSASRRHSHLNRKDIDMKKFLTVATSLVFACIFCVMAFAQSTTARGVACPLCDRGSLVTVKYGERSVPSLEPCSHGKNGYDHYTLKYYTYYVRCSNSCGYSEAPSDKEYLVSKTYEFCGGVSY